MQSFAQCPLLSLASKHPASGSRLADPDVWCFSGSEAHVQCPAPHIHPPQQRANWLLRA